VESRATRSFLEPFFPIGEQEADHRQTHDEDARTDVVADGDRVLAESLL
jgi:hypothetical protein